MGLLTKASDGTGYLRDPNMSRVRRKPGWGLDKLKQRLLKLKGPHEK